ncbi:MAG: insulinase family protein [Colwellia sp.]|nr:insulinase family protein [Colwellia sp.]
MHIIGYKQPPQYLLLGLILTLSFSLKILASDEIIQSEYDTNSYHSFTLANQLEVLVISDPSAKVAAVSLMVDVGYRSAPKNFLGLPHLLEHAVFLGSKKYPEKTGFDTFIKENNGWSNGSTFSDVTRYHFQINTNALDEGLSRLTDLIVNPSMEKQSIESALIAVDNEFHGRKSDWRGILSVMKQVSHQQHTFSKFHTGNKVSLGSNISLLQKELAHYFGQYYGAQNMKWVIYSDKPIDQLKVLAKKYLSAIKPSLLKGKLFVAPLHLKTQLGSKITVKTQSDAPSMDVRFEVPAKSALASVQVRRIIEQLLVDQAKGSLHHYLTAQGLIERIQVIEQGDRDYGMLDIYLPLTAKGFANTDAVLQAIFSYIHLLKAQPWPSYLFDQDKILAQRAFDFPLEQEPGDWISEVINYDMFIYPKEQWLNHGTLALSSVDFQKNVSEYLSHIVPENMQVFISHHSVSTDQVDPFYQTSYQITPYKPSLLKRWANTIADKSMGFPDKNPYIDSKTTFKTKEPQAKPIKLVNLAGITLWSQQTNIFKAPKTSAVFRLFSQQSGEVTEGVEKLSQQQLARELYSDIANARLSDKENFAYIAGIESRVIHTLYGYKITATGFSGPLFDYFNDVFSEFFKTKITKQEYLSAKEKLIYELSNYKDTAVRTQIKDALYQASSAIDYSNDKALQKLAALSFQDFLVLLGTDGQKTPSYEIQGIVAGQINEPSLTLFATALVERYSGQLASGKITDFTAVPTLPIEKIVIYNITTTHSDKGMGYVIQGSRNEIDSQALFYLSNFLMRKKYYGDIRDKHNLGYFVNMYNLSINKNANIGMIVQSSTAESTQLQNASNDFLHYYATELAAMSDAQFKENISNAIKKINMPEFSLKKHTTALANQLYNGYVNFDQDERISEQLKNLSKQDFESFYHKQIIGKEANRLLVLSSNSTKSTNK